MTTNTDVRQYGRIISEKAGKTADGLVKRMNALTDRMNDMVESVNMITRVVVERGIKAPIKNGKAWIKNPVNITKLDKIFAYGIAPVLAAAAGYYAYKMILNPQPVKPPVAAYATDEPKKESVPTPPRPVRPAGAGMSEPIIIAGEHPYTDNIPEDRDR